MKRERAQRQATRAFTILELMVVIVIIGILGGILTINLAGAADRAREDSTRTSMKAVKAALTMYYTRYTEYPPTGQLDLIRSENFIEEELLDSWGQPFDYYSPGENTDFVIISAGRDKQFETNDDIWVEADEQ